MRASRRFARCSKLVGVQSVDGKGETDQVLQQLMRRANSGSIMLQSKVQGPHLLQTKLSGSAKRAIMSSSNTARPGPSPMSTDLALPSKRSANLSPLLGLLPNNKSSFDLSIGNMGQRTRKKHPLQPWSSRL